MCICMEQKPVRGLFHWSLLYHRTANVNEMENVNMKWKKRVAWLHHLRTVNKPRLKKLMIFLRESRQIAR